MTIKQKYFVQYGCYINENSEVMEFESLEDAEKYAYEEALYVCDSSLYLHGFEPFSEEEAEEMDESERSAAEKEYCEEKADYWAELYDPEKHDQLL